MIFFPALVTLKLNHRYFEVGSLANLIDLVARMGPIYQSC